MDGFDGTLTEATMPETNRSDASRRVREVLSEWDGSTGSWYWLSFCDTSRPKGQRFVGACIVKAPIMEAAAMVAHAASCNPGGKVAMVQVDPNLEAVLHPKWTYRILNKDEIGECGLDMKEHRRRLQ